MLVSPTKVLSIVSLGAYYFTDDSWTCPPIRESFSVQGGQPPYWITTVYADTIFQLYPDVISVVGDLNEPLKHRSLSLRHLEIGMNISFAVEDSNHHKAYTSALVVQKGNRENCKKEFWNEATTVGTMFLLTALLIGCLFFALAVLSGWYERRALAEREKLYLEEVEQRRQSQLTNAAKKKQYISTEKKKLKQKNTDIDEYREEKKGGWEVVEKKFISEERKCS